MANVGLYNFIQIFLVTPRGRKLLQKFPPHSYLMLNPVYCPRLPHKCLNKYLNLTSRRNWASVNIFTYSKSWFSISPWIFVANVVIVCISQNGAPWLKSKGCTVVKTASVICFSSHIKWKFAFSIQGSAFCGSSIALTCTAFCKKGLDIDGALQFFL